MFFQALLFQTAGNTDFQYINKFFLSFLMSHVLEYILITVYKYVLECKSVQL